MGQRKVDHKVRIKAIRLFVILFLANSAWALSPVVDAVDWPAFLADQDLKWNKLPGKWYEGPFLGNGEQGTLMYKLDRRTLRWDVGCSAAHDHRPIDHDDLSEKNVVILNRGRHFIGHLRLELPTDITGAKSRLSLWDAEATGTLSSAGGTAQWTTLVHATEPVMRFELTATGNLKGVNFSYVAEEARSPRAVRAKTPRTPVNPTPVRSMLGDGVQTAVHNLYAGGQTAVAWKTKDVGGTRRLWLSVQHSFPGKDAAGKAVAAVRSAATVDPTVWVQTHRDWWHNYYPASFVSTGDVYWDAFYWIQQYKLACATRDKGWIIDNQGPWLQPTAWNGLWWNLNVQFHQLRGEGGFLVSARREQGQTQWVLVQADFGGGVKVEPQLADAQWTTSDGTTVRKNSEGNYSIMTSPGDWVMFWPRGTARPQASVTPVARRGESHHFGLYTD